jgi:hypothetical protein
MAMLEDPHFAPHCSAFEWLKSRRDGWQFGETGIIDAILEKIGEGSMYFFEGGAGDGSSGLPLTCQRLVDRGWRGDLYECDPASAAALRAKYAENTRIRVFEEKLIYLGNLKGREMDRNVYVIDVDSYDWVLFATLLMNNPMLPDLVVVEHMDMAHPLGAHYCVPPIANTGKPVDGSRIRAQASAAMLELLARGLYTPVCVTRVNTFFVRNELVDLLEVPTLDKK